MNFLKLINTMRNYSNIIAIQLIVVLCTLQSFGQPVFNDYSQVYDYWSKRGIIEVMFAYMKDYKATVSTPDLPKEKLKNFKQEQEGLNNFEEHFFDNIENIGLEELSTRFNELSSFLIKNNWPGAEKNVFQPLSKNLYQKIDLNNDFFSTLKPNGKEKSTDIRGFNNKLENWNKSIKRILSAYNKDIKKLRKGEGSRTPDSSETTKPSNGDRDTGQVNAKNQNWLNMALLCFLSFFIGIFLCYYLIRSKIYKIMGEELDKYKESIRGSGLFAFISMVELLNQRKNEYKNKLEAVEKTDKKPKDENNSFISLDKVNETHDSIIEETNKTVEWNIAIDSKFQTGLFFTIPDSEGNFEVSDGKTDNDGSCFYQIENKPNSNQALLTYISNEKDKRAIENIENYLLPVCEIENFSDRRMASKVLMKEPGIVNFKRYSWVIDTNHKVKIKLV